MMSATEQVIDNFINGRREPPAGGVYGRGDNIWHLPDSCALDVHTAIAAGLRSFGFWKALGRPVRARLLSGVARRLVVEARDPQTAAAALAGLRFPADRQLHTQSEGCVVPLSRSPAAIVKMLVPDGVGRCAWAERLAALLASGNCLVVGVLHNPGAEQTITLRDLSAIARGLPDGVLNVLYGRAATMGAALIKAEQAVSKPVFRLPAVVRSVSPRPSLN